MASTRKRGNNKNKTLRRRRVLHAVKTVWFPDSVNDTLYLRNSCSDTKITNFILDGYSGFTLLYLVYFSYNQKFIGFDKFKSFFIYDNISNEN